MRRRGGSLPAAGIRLIPLLSVLICTTGALVTLLVGFARQGQQALVEAAEESESDENNRDALEWRIGQLQQSRDKTQADLNDARLELSHLEDHLRRLRDRADRLRRAIVELERLEPEKRGQQQAAASELERLRGKLRAAEQAVAAAQLDAAGKPVKYSVVPYDGPFRTSRRPIYLECRKDCVVLQPEGIVFSEQDFEGPMGPGNPLAAALRAAREYLATAQPDLLEKQEPYPLLIVRPDAIDAYYMSQMALQSWGSQFGYELVGADWQLDFPEPDPQMASVMQSAIADARVRQQQLIAAAPSEYRKPKTAFRVKPNGGGIEPDPAAQSSRKSGGANPYKGLARSGGKGSGRGPGNGSATGTGTGSGSGGIPGGGALAAGTGAGNANGNSPAGGLAGGAQAGTGNGLGGPLQGGSSLGGGSGSGSDPLAIGAGGQQAGRGTGQGGSLLAGGPNGGGQANLGSSGGSAGTGNGGGNSLLGNGPGGNSTSGGGGPAGAGASGTTGSSGLFGAGAGASGNGQGSGGAPGSNSIAGTNASGGQGFGSSPGVAGRGTGTADGQGGDQADAGSGDGNGTSADGSLAGAGATGANATGTNATGTNPAGGSGSGGSGPAIGGLTGAQGSGNSPNGTGAPTATASANGPAATGSGGQTGGAPGPGSDSGPAAQGTGIVRGNADSKLRGTQGGKAVAVPQLSGVPTGGSGGSSSQDPNSQSSSSQSAGTQSSGSPGGQQGSGGSSQDVSMQPPQSQTVGMPSVNFQKRTGDSLAKSRGRDWALPDASASSVPVSRPVVIECRGDRLIIVGDDGKSVSKEILLTGKTTDSVDELRSAVWAHMKGWGAAGKGLYWKPTLSVRVAPDGRGRFDELQALFADSGLDMHESTRTAAPPPAPKKRWWK